MPPTADLIVFDDAKALAEGAARRVADFINARSSGTVTVAMAGGSTPLAMYGVLRELDVAWDKVYAWVGDERFVGPEHPDNNGAMIRRELIHHTDATFFDVPWRDDASPQDLATAYEQTLVEMMDSDDAGPRPDLILAGIGDDGHTLSLFPGTAALDETDRWFVANEVPQKNTWRLTATYPLAHRADEIIVLVSGEGKREALAKIMDDATAPPLPARRLMDGNRVTWLVDRAAAGTLAEGNQP